MSNVIRAELAMLTRRRVLVTALLASLAFAAITSLATFLAAVPEDDRPADPGQATLAELAEPAGASEAFEAGAGFLGLLVLVTFAARIAGEFSHGTLRTLLMKEPRRLRVLLGKVIALVAFMALVLLAAVALCFVASAVLAPGQGVDTSAWFGIDGLGEAAGDYAAALGGTSAWALYGTALAVILRSVAIAVAVGVAWAGPLEHITAESWKAADRWLPGLQLETIAPGGSGDVSVERALSLTAVYVAVAIAGALLSLVRRDIGA